MQFILLISGNISDRSDLQTLQNDALRVCFNVRLKGTNMHPNGHMDQKMSN